ncbi:carbohydrate kinase family protein [Dongia rigui]|uniref:Phosphofructokinase n=1 Tax=Dongia rigui TaxID=940149 RepID=A0ABU5DV82_9PROT|nr:carbohydrate kinase family protein [Dongia rigui]MDY0871197.1 carbohydrate kinase family protein [Dongia rigui]
MSKKNPSIIVAGGANLDIKSRIAGKTIPGTSNPGWTETSPGGVGRNIAENLARLGAKVGLLTLIGEDSTGDRLRRSARAVGIDTSLMMRRKGSTGTYSATLNAEGEMLIAVSDMSLIDGMKTSDITQHKDVLAVADLLVADGNLPLPCLKALLQIAKRAEIPLVLEPVSVPKAKRLKPLLQEGLPIAALTPNRDELAELTGLPVKNARDLTKAAQRLHERGVTHVLVGLGAEGCFLSTADEGQHLIPVRKKSIIKDVTGGGDAMVASLAFGLAKDITALQAARAGQELAARVVRSMESGAGQKRGRG